MVFVCRQPLNRFLDSWVYVLRLLGLRLFRWCQCRLFDSLFLISTFFWLLKRLSWSWYSLNSWWSHRFTFRRQRCDVRLVRVNDIWMFRSMFISYIWIGFSTFSLRLWSKFLSGSWLGFSSFSWWFLCQVLAGGYFNKITRYIEEKGSISAQRRSSRHYHESYMYCMLYKPQVSASRKMLNQG